MSTQTSQKPQRFSDLPGPRPWPLVGNAPQVDVPRMHLNIEAWVREYGSVFALRLGLTPVLVVSDHEVVSALLKDRPDGFRRPARLVDTIEEMGLKSGLFSAEGQAWQNQRRMVMASFSPSHVRAYFPALLKVTQRLHGRWLKAAGSGATIDLQADLMRFTVDAIAGLAFGSDINTLESDEEVIQHHLDKIFPALYKRINSLVPYWRFVKLPVDRQLDRSVAVVNQAIDGFIAKSRARLTANPALREQPSNLLEAMIVAADQSDSGVDDNDVAGNVITLLLAGEDTTATTIAWMIYLLSRNPKALRRAQDEALRVVGDLNDLTPDQMGAFEFIEACAHETMRLKPVAPNNVVEALRDTTVAGVEVPKGLLIWCVNRHDSVSERYFPDPTVFKPERWLEEEGSERAAGHSQAKRVSMPFGSGPRVCPGRYLAMLEIKLAMAMVLRYFDIDHVGTPDGGEAQEVMSFTMVPVGLTLKLRARA
ncbi:MAG: cytochrome P450 [Pseudomonadota bacterium]